MNPNDRELIYQLLEDASTLRGLVGENRRPTPQAARAIIAPILRRWIWEQTFSSVQKLLRPHIVKFPLYRMKAMIELCERGIVEHWMSMISVQGLAISSALPKAAYIKADGTSPLSEGRQDDLAQTLHPSRQFFNQKMFYWKDRFFTRTEILGIHANRLGGVHLDFRRREDETHIDELTQYFGLEVTGTNLQMLVGDSIREAKADAVRRPTTYDAMELVAIDTATRFTMGLKDSDDQIQLLLEGSS